MFNRMRQRYFAIFGTLIVISIINGLTFTSIYLKTKTHNNECFHQFNNEKHMNSKDKWIGNGDRPRGRKKNDTTYVHLNSITKSGSFAELLKMKPPVFLPEIKNPCWYGDDDNRREFWIQRLCSIKSKNKMICSLYSGGKKTKNIRLLRCLPYFLLIGQPKSGSSDLFYHITKHPDVLPGISKEMQWFARRRHCQYLNTDDYCLPTHPYTFTEYIDYFNLAAEKIHVSNAAQKRTFITGEGSQSTLWDVQWWWEFPENENDEEPGLLNAHFVRHLLPDVKLLVILRNPVDRLYSDYMYFNTNERKSAEAFHSGVRRSVTAFNDCRMTHSLRHCTYMYKAHYPEDVRVYVGLYSVFLEDWMTVFNRKQFFITSLDRYSRNRTVVISEIFKFLNLRDVDIDINRNEGIQNQMAASGRRVGDMLNKTRVLLEQFYKPFNNVLSSLLNDSIYLWDK